MTLDKSLRGGSETIQAEEEASIRRKGENCGDPEDFAVHNCSNTAIIAVLSNDASRYEQKRRGRLLSWR